MPFISLELVLEAWKNAIDWEKKQGNRPLGAPVAFLYELRKNAMLAVEEKTNLGSAFALEWLSRLYRDVAKFCDTREPDKKRLLSSAMSFLVPGIIRKLTARNNPDFLFGGLGGIFPAEDPVNLEECLPDWNELEAMTAVDAKVLGVEPDELCGVDCRIVVEFVALYIAVEVASPGGKYIPEFCRPRF